ncbi:GNAT family N-acetyltransferase [bacterium]|nr:GNAT family N-acetyltransferase [bacterium]MCB2179160.1 GNAT family N-acetyltransferase [bacterium]
MTVEILPASLKDLFPLRKLEKICFPVDAWPMLDLIGALSFSNVVRYKGAVGEELMAFIAGEIRTSTRTGWIATVCVHPDYRRQGIAHQLLDLVEPEMEQPRVRLTVRETNVGAIALYHHRGYYEVNRWRNYYKGGEDGIVMEKLM